MERPKEDIEGGKDAEHVAKKSRLQLNNSSAKKALMNEIKLCAIVSRGEVCQFGDACKFSHDLEAYLASKPDDLGEECPNIKATGTCRFGFQCRFQTKGHASMVKEKKVDQEPAKSISVDELRRRDFSFPRSDAYMRGLKEGSLENSSSIVESYAFGEKKRIDFSGKLSLAPLTTVGNLPFRRICKEFGADITCGEMAMVNNLLKGQSTEWALLKRHPSEDLFGVQVCGGWTDSMTQCAELIADYVDTDFIDINMGCPIELVYSKGMGSGLMEKTKRVQEIVKGMSTVIGGRMQLTVKIRMGVYDNKPTAHKLVPRLAEWGASAVTIHGRSRQQRYTKEADWSYIQSCVSAVEGKIPIIGNGDIMSYEDYERDLALSGVTTTMIGRGALVKPWIFTEIKERRHWDISSGERFDMLKSYTTYGLEHFGSDSAGVEKTRRFLLEWLSFLHRYVPVGILERLPQKINHRPPAYFGRDELETLMASDQAQDWTTITERLLGKAPEGFKFTPKHKSNSYGVSASDRLQAVQG